MNVNLMNLLLAKTVAEQQGVPAQRAFEIALVSSMLPGWTGLMLAVVAAKNDAPKKPTDTKDEPNTIAAAGTRPLPPGPTAK